MDDNSARHDTAVELAVNDDAAQREAAIRRREIILKIEEHAAGYQRTTGAAYRYIAEMVNATPGEWEWIKTYIAEHPEVLNLPYHSPTQWDDIHRTRGNEALHNAKTADANGNQADALDFLDEARARGVISPTAWRSGHDYLYNHQSTAGSTATSDEHRSTETDAFTDEAMQARRQQVRERQLLLAITQHGPSLRGAGTDWLRDVAALVNATDQEREWMAAQVRANPGMLDGEQLGDGRISDTNRRTARRAFAAATNAIRNADYITALNRLDDAEVHWPAGHPDRGGAWDQYRTVVLDLAQSTEDQSESSSGFEPGWRQHRRQTTQRTDPPAGPKQIDRQVTRRIRHSP